MIQVTFKTTNNEKAVWHQKLEFRPMVGDTVTFDFTENEAYMWDPTILEGRRAFTGAYVVLSVGFSLRHTKNDFNSHIVAVLEPIEVA